jgi:hypothetical protein
MANKTFLSEFDWPDRDSWSAGGVWLGYTLFWGFLPLWLGSLGLAVLAILGVLKQSVTWADFLIHGEFLIYAVSIAAPSTRLISSDMNPRRPFAFRAIFNLVAYAIVVPSAAIYAIIKVLSFLNLQPQANIPLMFWLSVPVVVVSVVFSLVVFVLDHHRMTTPFNVAAEIKKEEDELSHNFDRLENIKAPDTPNAEPRPQRGDENG